MRGITALIGQLGQVEGEGRRPGAAGIAAAPDRAKQRRGGGKKRRKVKGKPLTGGAGVSAGEEKEKGKRRCGPLRGRAIEGCLAEVPKGKARLIFFLFFQSFFKSILFISNSNQKSSNLSQNFINILEFTQATKNYAKPNNDAQSLVVSRLIKLRLIFYSSNLNSI
jgi:hypothetical protein